MSLASKVKEVNGYASPTEILFWTYKGTLNGRFVGNIMRKSAAPLLVLCVFFFAVVKSHESRGTEEDEAFKDLALQYDRSDAKPSLEVRKRPRTLTILPLIQMNFTRTIRSPNPGRTFTTKRQDQRLLYIKKKETERHLAFPLTKY